MKRTVALAALSVIVSHTLSRTAYQVLLTAIRDDLLDGSNQVAGLGATATFAGYMLGVAIVTVMSGRIEPRTSLIVGLWMSGGAFLVLTTARQFWQLAVGLGMAGLGSAGIWLSVPAIATAAVPPSRRGMVMGLMSSSIGLGLVATGQAVRVVRGLADDDQAWRPIWVGAASFTFVVFVLVVLFLRPEPTERVETRLNLNALRQVDGWVALTSAYLFFGFIVSAYAPFLGAALKTKDFSEAHIATLYSLIGFSAIFGAVSLGRVSDMVGRKPVLIGCMATIGLSAALILVGREPYATISVVINGIASFSYPVLVTTTLRDHTSDRLFSNALGTITLIYGISLVLGPMAAGAIGDSPYGFDALYTLVVAASGGAVLCIAALPESRRT